MTSIMMKIRFNCPGKFIHTIPFVSIFPISEEHELMGCLTGRVFKKYSTVSGGASARTGWNSIARAGVRFTGILLDSG